MKPGQTIESAAWLTGEETPALRKKYEADVCGAMDELCNTYGLMRGPVKFFEKEPGTDRVPEVPDHIQGADVKLLVGECVILGRKPEIKTRSFIGDLEKKDLERLRLVTRQSYRRHFPDKPELTDAECDDIIEGIGPEAAFDVVRNATDAVH